MKKVVIAALGTVALSFGTAYAGGGCNYGKHAAEVAETEAPVLAAAEEVDPKLLAKIKEREEQEALEKLIETPVIHN
ncbi:MAG: hypothetical protein KTR32_20480 [Granulosicoccus sp.]|nr:hypothetical protein [Granulosicoccus sp.]